MKPILTKPKPKVEPPPEENKEKEAQPPADSEMQDTNNDSQKVEKSEELAGDQAPPENMETN